MKEVKLIILLFVIMAATFAQTTTKTLAVSSKITKSTDVLVENYRIKKAVTLYDLALNLSYFHHLSTGFTREHLTLPVVLINNKYVVDNKIADIKITEVNEYTFKSGVVASVLYGSKGRYGVLSVNLKGESADEQE
ncbi:hypothetical protein [Marinilabilia salmonicolor]|uniref:TonB-dependent receptor-like protein n=1 Tax=Marinilabilia salmonicolor TaxID=989 RepID=A0A368VHS4_9BACT|nr:hypothetical protein [Marinilabilia salmonicolor]RCW38551.1 hypothetical protein DFO77_10316 [Marinilabilia salmonicolor]